MANYWVLGGEYASTEFRDMVNGGKPQKYGPFATYEDARAAWLAHSWADVDNCHVRFIIASDDQPKSSASAAA